MLLIMSRLKRKASLSTQKVYKKKHLVRRREKKQENYEKL
jgi:hypothetical protein